MAEERREYSEGLAVLVSKMEAVTTQLASLMAQFAAFTAELPAKLESTYLRKETFEVTQQAVNKALKDLEDENLTHAKAHEDQAKERRADRRLAWSAIAAPILVAVVLYVLIGKR